MLASRVSKSIMLQNRKHGTSRYTRSMKHPRKTHVVASLRLAATIITELPAAASCEGRGAPNLASGTKRLHERC